MIPFLAQATERHGSHFAKIWLDEAEIISGVRVVE